MQHIVGHDWAVAQLQSAIANKRTGHAYLITGPQRVGRTTLATAFAQALNCTNEVLQNRPCRQCRSCKLIANGRHPDLRIVKPEVSGRGNAVLKIDQIRQLQRDLNLAAIEGPFKIAILTDFQTANPAAANAFLKTLEEPPNRVVLILTASEADSLLPTINSRCHTLNLRPVPTQTVLDYLQKAFQMQPDMATPLAHLANGRIGWAIEAAENQHLVESHQEMIKSLIEIMGEDRVGRFAVAEKVAKQPDQLQPLIQTWLSWWRDALIKSKGDVSSTVLINVDQLDLLEQFVNVISGEAISESLKGCESALEQISQNANIRLVVENLFLT
ncbi:MAG: DNA polymerase III subunit delta', partial [Chloroflexota bacterium]